MVFADHDRVGIRKTKEERPNCDARRDGERHADEQRQQRYERSEGDDTPGQPEHQGREDRNDEQQIGVAFEHQQGKPNVRRRARRWCAQSVLRLTHRRAPPAASRFHAAPRPELQDRDSSPAPRGRRPRPRRLNRAPSGCARGSHGRSPDPARTRSRGRSARALADGPLAKVGVAAIGMGPGIPRHQRNCATAMLDRQVEIATPLVGSSKIAVPFCVIGRDRQPRFERGNRRVEVAVPQKVDAPVHVRFRIRRQELGHFCPIRCGAIG
jgi:hypothetical protein